MTDIANTQILTAVAAGLGRPRRLRRFLYVSTWLLVGLGSFWAMYAATQHHVALLAGDLVLIAFGTLSLILLRTGHVTAVIHLLLLSLLIWIPAMAFFVSGTGVDHNGAVHYWLIVYIVALHFVLFDAARITQTFYVCVAILEFVVIEYALVPLSPRYGFPEHESLFGHGLTLGLVLIAISLITRTYITELADAERRAREANIRSEQLLHSVLPASIIERVRTDGTTFTQKVEGATVLFADLVGFTPLASRLSAEDLVALLNRVFSQFDELTARYGVEKIKTIGDGYMAACGLPEPCADHAQRVARLGLSMLQVVNEFEELSIRIGIDSGPVIAGIIGQRRIAFDLWGETVNIASRMESHGVPGKIQVTEATRQLLGEQFTFTPARKIDVKGKGEMSAHLLVGEVA